MKTETVKASSRGGDASNNHLNIHRFAEGHAMEGSKFNAAAGVPDGLIEAIRGSASDAIIASESLDHLLESMNARMIETSFDKPSVRARRRSLNRFARSREIVWRFS